MTSIERLMAAYRRRLGMPWERAIAGPQRVWFAFFDPADERRLRARIGEFEIATNEAGHGWSECDLTDAFPRWMARHEYRDAYFEQPDLIDPALDGFRLEAVAALRRVVAEGDPDSVAAVTGLASLFGLMRASYLIGEVDSAIRGRLLVLFPGEREGANFRFLDSRDGWNYLGIPITDEEE